MAKTFDQTLAESGRQSTLDELRRTGQYDAAASEYNAGRGPYAGFGSGFSSGGGGGSSINFQDITKQALEMSKQANAPAVASLSASLPEIGQSFTSARDQVTAQVEPLKERYKNLLDEVTGRAQASENAQTRITSNELGKRGIVGSSTLADQEIQNAVEPIRAGARTAIKDIGLAGEEGQMQLQNMITNLTTSEVEQKRAVQNAIAQLEAGGGQSAISNAIQVLQMQTTQQATQASQELARQQQELAQKIYDNISIPESKASIANLNSKTSSGTDLSSFLSMFGYGGSSSGSSKSTGTFSIGSNVINLLKAGNVKDALALAMNP